MLNYLSLFSAASIPDKLFPQTMDFMGLYLQPILLSSPLVA